MNEFQVVTIDESALADTEAVLELLGAFGVVVVRGYATSPWLADLSREHQLAFDVGGRGISRVQYRRGMDSRALRIRADQLVTSLPAIQRFMADSRIHRIGGYYLGPGARVNEAAYLTLDRPNEKPVTALHYDRIHALKAFLYLTNADRASGALEVVPGSHVRGRDQRLTHLRLGVPIEELPITVGHDDEQPAAIEGPAGTLTIFDTDCLHRGGVIEEPNVRRVLRSHSHAAAGQE